MNIKKLSDKELNDLINTTTNVKLLEQLENEYVDRIKVERWEIADNDIDEAIMKEINATWRQG